MSNRQSGIILSFNGHTGLIDSDTGRLFFRSENRAFIAMPLKEGDAVTFSVSPNTSYDSGMDLAVSILVDGYAIPQRKHSEVIEAMKAREKERQARVAAACKRLRNSADTGWFIMMYGG